MKKSPLTHCFCEVGGSFCVHNAEKKDEERSKLTHKLAYKYYGIVNKHKGNSMKSHTYLHTLFMKDRKDITETHNLLYIREHIVTSIFSRDARSYTGRLSHWGHPAGNNVPSLWSHLPKNCATFISSVYGHTGTGTQHPFNACVQFPVWHRVLWLSQKLCCPFLSQQPIFSLWFHPIWNAQFMISF